MLTVPVISDNFDRADSDTMGGDFGSVSSWWPAPTARHAQIRETCETIQQVAITIAIPVFAVLGALLLAGLIRAVWML